VWQSLLADRFKLVLHRERKEVEAYLLLVGSRGPKLKESPADDSTPSSIGGYPGHIIAQQSAMESLAGFLSPVNRTLTPAVEAPANPVHLSGQCEPIFRIRHPR